MLSPRWRKVVRDLCGNKTRTVLIVLAIAVGVFAFGSVFITQDVLISDMNGQYRAINPSTITLYLRSSDDSLVRWALRHDDITAAQMKAVYLVKLLEGDNTYNLYLNVFPDYENMTLDRITLEKGNWPLEREEIIFERASLPLTGTNIGGRVLVEMPHGGKRELTVTGTAHDLNTFPASMFPELNGYIDLRTLAWLGLPAEYTRIDMVTREGIDSVAELEVIANELRGELQRTGIEVNSFSVREPGEHWAREVTESFTLILGFIGIFSLVLSGFLVVNTISALLAEQRRQIGMLKAIGGTGKQIIGIYLVLVAFYGVLALFVAVPVGMGLAYVFTMTVVQFLNINLINFHLPIWVLVLQCIAALLVPLIASAVPILGGVRITVRESVSNYGIGTKESHRLVDRLLMRLRWLSRPLLLSMRNTFRRKWRLLMTLGTLTLAGTLFITVVNVRGSLMTELDGIIERVFNYEVVLALDDSYQSQGVVRRVEDVKGVAKAEGRTTIRVERIKPDKTKGASFPVVGLPAETDFMQPVLLSGRWLEENDRNAVVLTSSLMEDMAGVNVGDKLIVEYDDREYEWDVVGAVVMAWDRAAYANFNYISRIKGETGMATTVQVSTEQKDAQTQLDMARVLEQRLKGAGIEVVYSMTKDVIVSANASQFDFLIAFLMAMAAMTALIGGLGLAGMMSLNVMERTREIGVMRSIGASNSMIGRIVVTEGLFIGIISWILALPLSIPMSLVFNSMLGGMMIDQPLVFVFAPFGIVAWLAIVICVSIIASLLPAYRAVKMSIRETLAYE